MNDSTRRRFLAAVSTAGVGGVAGCSQLTDSSESVELGETTVLNQTSRRLAGTITVTGPDGETALDDTFDVLGPESAVGDETPTDDTEFVAAGYEDVFTGTGTYGVAVQLDENSAVAGVREAEATLEVTDTGDERILVEFDGDDESEPVTIELVEEGPAIG